MYILPLYLCPLWLEQISPRTQYLAQIDTAKTYSQGTSEVLLGKINWKERGLAMDTKLYPNAVCYCSLQAAFGDYGSRTCVAG